MSDSKAVSVKKQLFIFLGVAAVAFGALIYFSRDTLNDTWQTLLDAKLGYILLLPLLQVINYFFIGLYYRSMFASFRTFFTRGRAWGVVAAMNFVNQILPSGGLSGITYLAYGFRSKLSTGKTTLIQLGRYVFVFLGYALLGPVALLLLVLNDDINEFGGVLNDAADSTAAVATLVVFGIIAVFVASLMFNPKLSHRLAKYAVNVLGLIKKHIFRSRKPLEMKFLRRIYKEFHEGIDFIKRRGTAALKPGLFMVVSAMAELSIVYTALLAVGQAPPLGVVFIAFVAANMVGVVSIIPGDVGVHEAVVIIVLSAFGVPEAAAISATLLYRVFNKFIFLPIGFYFYARILKPAVEEA